jgi:Fic family protein
LMTPAEVAFFAQKFYVEIHPFSEGNGRTSRVIQELILSQFDMPAASSGDLMDYDVLTNHEDYYQLAIKKTDEQMKKMDECISQYKTLTQFGRRKLSEQDQSSLDYDCRTLK